MEKQIVFYGRAISKEIKTVPLNFVVKTVLYHYCLYYEI